MSLDVLGEMVRPHEAAVADAADELLLASVGTFVARQLVAAGELSLAPGPRAAEGFLASMRASMRFQVRRFEVVLAAAGVQALVETTPRLRRGWRHEPHRGRR